MGSGGGGGAGWGGDWMRWHGDGEPEVVHEGCMRGDERVYEGCMKDT